MALCNYCGVELEENINYCPLCGLPVMVEDERNLEYIRIKKNENDEELISGYNKLTRKQQRKLFWELSGIILISGMIATSIIDLFINGNITWSKYVITICLVIFANITLISFLGKKIVLLFTGSFLSLSILFILLNIFSDHQLSGLKLGIPLLVAAYLITLGLISLIRISGQRGLNVIAYSFIAIGLLLVCTEGVISLYTLNTLKLYWSILVFASIVPVAAILIFIHYRLKKGTDLKKFFHI